MDSSVNLAPIIGLALVGLFVSSGPLQAQFQCGQRDCQYLTPAQMAFMEQAILTEVCEEEQSNLLALLWGGQWGRHWSFYGVDGSIIRVDLAWISQPEFGLSLYDQR